MKIDTSLVPAELEQRFSDFFTGYTQAMAFTSSRDEGEDGEHDGEPLFACRGEFTDTFPEPWADFSQLLTDTEIAELYNDAADFFMTAKDMIEGDDEQAGRDFHYTRCGHGCGYWDGHWDQHGDKLTELARPYGTLELYGSVNDDGEVTSAYLSH